MTKRCLSWLTTLVVLLLAAPICIYGFQTTGVNNSRRSASQPERPPAAGVGGQISPTTTRTPNPERTNTPVPHANTTPRAQEATTTPINPPGVLGPGETPAPTPAAAPTSTPYLTAEELGGLDWLREPLFFGLVAFLILLALGLHLFHILRLGGLRRDIGHLAMAQRNLGNVARAPTLPGRNPATDRMAEQLNQQGQSLAEFSNRFNQIENRFTINDSQFRDAVHAVTLTANWIGQAQLRESFNAADGNLDESERAATIAVLERYQEPLRLNASRVEPVAQNLTEVIQGLAGRAYASPELMARLESLSQDISRFEQWQSNLSAELTSLQRGSFSQRSAGLQAEQERLLDQVNNGSLSLAQMVKKSRALLDHYLPESSVRSPQGSQPLPDRERELKKLIADAPDYLMNWYDTLFQLQNQIGGSGQRSAAEAEVANDLLRVQQMAREALGKFDIQPEAIQIGQTNYDRRLHEAALVRQAPQFPINTVIEVHKCGFRKMSTGEVLRMPQVVVAGAAAT